MQPFFCNLAEGAAHPHGAIAAAIVAGENSGINVVGKPPHQWML
jgi:hypothetical protein